VAENNSSPRSASRPDRTAPESISKADVRGILAECVGMGLPEEFDDDTPIVIDSYAATWIQHLLEERHGLVVRLSHEITSEVDSVDKLHTVVNGAVEGTGQEGVNGA
jgi:hypothetical protein